MAFRARNSDRAAARGSFGFDDCDGADEDDEGVSSKSFSLSSSSSSSLAEEGELSRNDSRLNGQSQDPPI